MTQFIGGSAGTVGFFVKKKMFIVGLAGGEVALFVKNNIVYFRISLKRSWIFCAK